MADMGGPPLPRSERVTPTHPAAASGIAAWACCYAAISRNNREDKPATQLQTEFKHIRTNYTGLLCTALGGKKAARECEGSKRTQRHLRRANNVSWIVREL